MRFLLLGAAALLLAACSTTDGPGLPRFLRGDDASAAAVPGAYGAALEPASTPGALRRPQEFAARRAEADALLAQARAAGEDEEKAGLYGDLADDYPEHPQAAQSRYLQGLHYYRAGDWSAAISAFDRYVKDVPVNPNAPQVEEMLFQSGRRYVEADGGIFDVFRDDGTGLDAIRSVPIFFPAGRRADDALLYLARYYRDEGELQRASLYYKDLLQRYPDSEWSFEARRELGETYARRDVDEVYHAGFVDRDPREPVLSQDPKALAYAGPVRSALGMSLEEYDKYLERIARDPGRRAEYAARVREVDRAKADVRERLARKDDRTAAWYAGQGDARAADVYRRSAAARRRGLDHVPVPGLQMPPAAPGPASPAPQPLPAPTPTPPPSPAPATPGPGIPPPPAPPSWPDTATPAAPRAPRPIAPPSGAYAVPPPPPPPSWPASR